METMTVEDAMNITARMLSEIKIPVGMMQQVGVPIERAIVNINECVKALEESKARYEAEKEEAETESEEETEESAE